MGLYLRVYIYVSLVFSAFILLGKTSFFWVCFLFVIGYMSFVLQHGHLFFHQWHFNVIPCSGVLALKSFPTAINLFYHYLLKAWIVFTFMLFAPTASFLLTSILETFYSADACHSCLFQLCRYPAIRHLSSCGILVTRTPPLLGTAVPGQVLPSNGFFNLADSFSKRKEYSERRIIG